MLLGVFCWGSCDFLSSKQTYRIHTYPACRKMAFAMDFITRDIRMAGYRSCLSGSIPTPINGTNDTGLNGSDTISITMSDSALPVVLTTTSYSINNGISTTCTVQNDGVNNLS